MIEASSERIFEALRPGKAENSFEAVSITGNFSVKAKAFLDKALKEGPYSATLKKELKALGLNEGIDG